MGELGRDRQQSVGHIGPKHILAFTMNSVRLRNSLNYVILDLSVKSRFATDFRICFRIVNLELDFVSNT